MKKQLLLTALSLLSMTGLMAAETSYYNYTSTEPKAGQVTEMGSCRIYYPGVPNPNPDCVEPATLSRDGVLLQEVVNTSGQIQRFIMQSDNCYTILFSSQMITTPGVYKVHVPEGFMTFDPVDDGSGEVAGQILSAEVNLEYVIPYPKTFTVDPPTGYVERMPNRITITFDGVKEIVDNKTPLGVEDVGGIRFDSSEWYLLPDVEIEGNKLILICDESKAKNESGDTEGDSASRAPLTRASDEVEYFEYTGEYMLEIWPDNLTFTMEDGTISGPDKMRLIWYLPNIDIPSITPAPGEVESLSEITVTLQGSDKFGMFNGQPSIYVLNDAGEKNGRAGTGSRETGVVRKWNTNSITFNLSNTVTKPGEYLLSISKSSFAIQGPGNNMMTDIWNNVPYEYRYTIKGTPSAVETLPEEQIDAESAGDVYNIAGVCVSRNMTREEMKSLPAGLYIHNGKKILIK